MPIIHESQLPLKEVPDLSADRHLLGQDIINRKNEFLARLVVEKKTPRFNGEKEIKKLELLVERSDEVYRRILEAKYHQEAQVHYQEFVKNGEECAAKLAEDILYISPPSNAYREPAPMLASAPEPVDERSPMEQIRDAGLSAGVVGYLHGRKGLVGGELSTAARFSQQGSLRPRHILDGKLQPYEENNFHYHFYDSVMIESFGGSGKGVLVVDLLYGGLILLQQVPLDVGYDKITLAKQNTYPGMNLSIRLKNLSPLESQFYLWLNVREKTSCDY